MTAISNLSAIYERKCIRVFMAHTINHLLFIAIQRAVVSMVFLVLLLEIPI